MRPMDFKPKNLTKIGIPILDAFDFIVIEPFAWLAPELPSSERVPRVDSR